MKKIACFFAVVLAFAPCRPAAAQTKDFFPSPVLVDEIRLLKKRIALVVGIDYPEGSSYGCLKWTVDDAVEIGWLLKEQYGFEVICAITGPPRDRADGTRQEHLRALDARIGPEHTCKNGLERLFMELVRKAKASDSQVVVFISAHGVENPNNKESGLIVPTGGKIEDYYATMIDMDIFEDLQGDLGARHVLFILDSCYSGIAGAFIDKTFVKGSRELSAEQVKGLMGARSRQIITASDVRQPAAMLEDKEMSAFTYWLKLALELDGPKVRADSNDDGVVTFGELYEYVYPELDRYYSQRPGRFNLDRSATGQFVFAHIGLDLSGARTRARKTFQGGSIIGKPARQGRISYIEDTAPPLSGPGNLLFEVEPAGGAVRLVLESHDGAYRETFPELPDGVYSLAPGTYRARFSRDLYKDRTIDDIEVKTGEFETVRAILLPDFGTLIVESEPEGAVVYLEDARSGRGQRLGETRLVKTRIPSGSHRIRLELDHYKTKTVDLVLKAGQSCERTVALDPDFGYVNVYSQPRGPMCSWTAKRSARPL